MGTMWCLFDPTSSGWCKNGCSFHGLRAEDPNQHLKDFLKLVDSLDLNCDNRERMRMHLFQFSFCDQASNWLEFPHHGIDLWLQVQIFYDHIDHTLKRTVDYAAEGRLRKMSAEKAWNTIEKLARYKEEGWNDPIFPEEGNLNYKNANIEQLLGVMECQVDMLTKDAISLMGEEQRPM
ncbi:hypothetical protein Tco_0741769 [Tanacetum coccineum]